MWNVTSLGQRWVSPPVDSPGGVVRCTCRTHARSRADEVLIQVAASGVGYWEDVVRSGDWDVGGALPMALGVETAGTVTAVGSEVTVFGVGDEVLTHCVPLREQGAWAEQAICAAADCAGKPPGVAWSDAAVFPVPALTAAQVVDDALALQPGETLLVHGAGGVTGRLIVQLAVVRGARVIATRVRPAPKLSAPWVLRKWSTITMPGGPSGFAGRGAGWCGCPPGLRAARRSAACRPRRIAGPRRAHRGNRRRVPVGAGLRRARHGTIRRARKGNGGVSGAAVTGGLAQWARFGVASWGTLDP